jgi:hypothetical protein
VTTGRRGSTAEGFETVNGDRLWQTRLPLVAEGPIGVFDDLVVIGGRDVALSLDRRTGKVVGQMPVVGTISGPPLMKSGVVHYAHHGGIEAVAVDGRGGDWSAEIGPSILGGRISRIGTGVIVASRPDGSIVGYSAGTGDRLWQRHDLTPPMLPPLVDEWVVVGLRDDRFVLMDPWWGRSRVALEPGERETFSAPAAVRSPLAWVLSGRTAYIVQDGEVAAYNVRRGGEPEWTHPLPTEAGWEATTPLLTIDAVLVSTPEGLIALRR